MSDGQKLPAVRYRLSAYRYPLSYWTVFPKAGGGARLRRRGDSPALTRGLRVVVSPDGDEHKMLPAAAPPLVAGATTLPAGKRVTGFSDIGPDIYRKAPLWAG